MTINPASIVTTGIFTVVCLYITMQLFSRKYPIQRQWSFASFSFSITGLFGIIRFGYPTEFDQITLDLLALLFYITAGVGLFFMIRGASMMVFPRREELIVAGVAVLCVILVGISLIQSNFSGELNLSIFIVFYILTMIFVGFFIMVIGSEHQTSSTLAVIGVGISLVAGFLRFSFSELLTGSFTANDLFFLILSLASTFFYLGLRTLES